MIETLWTECGQWHIRCNVFPVCRICMLLCSWLCMTHWPLQNMLWAWPSATEGRFQLLSRWKKSSWIVIMIFVVWYSTYFVGCASLSLFVFLFLSLSLYSSFFLYLPLSLPLSLTLSVAQLRSSELITGICDGLASVPLGILDFYCLLIIMIFRCVVQVLHSSRGHACSRLAT